MLLVQAAQHADYDVVPRQEEEAVEIESSGESRPHDSVVFEHFVAHNKTMTCSADEHARPFNNQIRGVNLVRPSWSRLSFLIDVVLLAFGNCMAT